MVLYRNPPDETAKQRACEGGRNGLERTALWARVQLRWIRAHRDREAPWGAWPSGPHEGGR
jgi:hypothetical protein